MDSVRLQPRRRRIAARTMAILTCVGLAACLAEPEQRVPIPPTLPTLPVTPVETAFLDPLVDTRPMVADLMRSLPYRNDPGWYDGLASALQPFIEADRRSAPLPALLDALADPDVATRRGAAIILAGNSRWYWQDHPEELAAALAAAARDSDARVRENAVLALGPIRPFALVEPALLVALDDANPRVRWAAVRSLTWRDYSETVSGRLAGALEDPDARVRIAAAYFHGFGGGDSGAVLDGILRRLRSGDPVARRAAAEQVQFFSHAIDDATLPTVVAMLDDPDVRVRQDGAATLSGVLFRRRYAGSGQSEPVPGAAALARRLAVALANSDADVRTFAAWGLRSLGDAAKPVIPDLSAALEAESDPEARVAMRYARGVVSGDGGAAGPVEDGTLWSDPALCLDHSDYALGGLRPWDPEQKASDLLGEPGEIAGGWSESDGGSYAVYRYRYPDLDVDVAGYGVEMLTTTSPSIVVGQYLRIGMSRERVLSEVFGIPPTAEPLAARRYLVTDCENPYQEVYFQLDFDRDGLLWRMQLFAEQP